MKQMHSTLQGSIFYLCWRQRILELWPIKLHQPFCFLDEEDPKNWSDLWSVTAVLTQKLLFKIANDSISSITTVLKFPSGIKNGIMVISTNRILLGNKKEHILIQATPWKDLKIIRLQNRNQIQKSTYYMILFSRNSKSKSKLGVGEWAINGKWVHGDLGGGSHHGSGYKSDYICWNTITVHLKFTNTSQPCRVRNLYLFIPKSLLAAD